LGKRISNLSLSLSLGAFSLTLSRVALSLVAVSRLRLYESCCAFYGIARGNTALFIYLFFVLVLLVVRSKGKYRKSRESVRLRKICASSRTPPSPPRTKDRFEEKDSREMRALLLCVAVHIALLLYKGKKSTFTTTKEKAHVRRKSKRSTPPNTVTQTVHHERAFKSILRERERQRERETKRRTRARPTVQSF